ncbi:unnamed protein product, partial [Scytosiphon promiscuus]
EQQEHRQQPVQHPRRRRDPERLVRQRGREPPTPTAESLNGRGADQDRGWQLHHSSTGLPFYFNLTTEESVWARGNTGASHGTYLGGDSRGKDAAIVPGRFAGKHSGSARGSAGGSAVGSSEDGSSSSDSSDTISTSSASCASHGECDPNLHRKLPHNSWNNDERTSHSFVSTTGGSWTSSMEIGFRRMVGSEEGRKMLAMEVEALNLREVARRARPKSST